MFEGFTTISPVSPDYLEQHASAVPEVITQLWREHGTGLIGDGFVRVLDPGRATTMLAEVLGDTPGPIPVFATALADLVVYAGQSWFLFDFRFAGLRELSEDIDVFVPGLADDELVEQFLPRYPYREAVPRLGVPDLDECYGYAPLLAFGGSDSPDQLERVKLWEHLLLIVQAGGSPLADS